MDNINKIISFTLGLIVVVIFLVIISGRLQIGKRFFTASRGSTTTGTPVQSNQEISATITISPSQKVATQTITVSPSSTRSIGRVESIPNTGADETMAIMLISAAISGYGLWKLSEA